MIANQQWSYAGDGERNPISLLQLQPSLAYVLKHGLVLVCGPPVFPPARTTVPRA